MIQLRQLEVPIASRQANWVGPVCWYNWNTVLVGIPKKNGAVFFFYKHHTGKAQDASANHAYWSRTVHGFERPMRSNSVVKKVI